MTHAFAKDSHACAVCLSWGGRRDLSEDKTLVHVDRYSVEGECRTAVSQDYRRVTKSYHTCEAWSPITTLKSHGARHSRSPGPSAAMAGVLAASHPARRVPETPTPTPGVTPIPTPAPAPVVEEVIPCESSELDVDKTPPAARVLYGYWYRLRGDRDMPRATEIDTARVRDGLSRLCLLVPTADGLDFEYRACGRSVARRFPEPLPGRRLADCHEAPVAERLRRDLAACLRERREMALLVRGDTILPGQRFVELLLPLSDADGDAAMVLAYRHVPGG